MKDEQAPRHINQVLADGLERLARRMEFDVPAGGLPQEGYPRRAYIRDLYRAYEQSGDPTPVYMVDWVAVMTPIELSAWESIRYRNLPLLPQYPVGRFFADFADPAKKIVIECDGRAFHADKEADAVRDAEMIADGWRVFRIEGWECKQSDIDWEQIAELRRDGDSQRADMLLWDWMMQSADGVICAIGCEFYGNTLNGVESALIQHTLVHHERSGGRRGR